MPGIASCPIKSGLTAVGDCKNRIFKVWTRPQLKRNCYLTSNIYGFIKNSVAQLFTGFIGGLGCQKYTNFVAAAEPV